MRNPISVPIIKPVNGLCNLCCHYCYMQSIREPQRSDHRVMEPRVLRATIDFFCSQHDEVEFIWHGGEPLLAGKLFFRKVVEYQSLWQRRGKRIANFVQTNALLVDDKWVDLFSQAGFRVGVSLDSPAVAHKALRTSFSGSDTTQQTLEKIGFLKEAGVFNGVSCCVGRHNFQSLQEMFDFFLGHDIKAIKFLRIRDGVESISPLEYADFLIRAFHLWLNLDDVDLEIRDIKSVVEVLLGGEFRECTLMGRCDQFVTVYSDGSIFPCDSFLNEDQSRFGTVFDSYQTVLQGRNFQNFLEHVEQRPLLCDSCRWTSLCNGGCLKTRLSSEHEDSCRANRIFFEEVESTLNRYGLLQ